MFSVLLNMGFKWMAVKMKYLEKKYRTVQLFIFLLLYENIWLVLIWKKQVWQLPGL